MTKEEIELLTKVLCEQLPYGVIVNASHKDGDGWKNNDRKLLGVYQHDGQVYLDGVYTSIDNVKPYLRPLSSITEEEARALFRVIYPDCHVTKVIIKEDRIRYIAVDNERSISGRLTIFFDNPNICNLAQLDWFLANHFDVRGLIPKGLAIAAVGEDNPYEE